MKLRITIGLVAALLAGQLLAQDKAGSKPELKNLTDQASYAFGVNLGKSLKNQGVDLNINLLVRGLQDVLSDKKLALSDEEIDTVVQKFLEEMNAKLVEKMKVEGTKNKKAGDAFLATNKKDPEVKTTESGLQYKIIKQGKGAKPTVNDVVSTNYRGKLLNGTEFDSSYKRGKPAEFPVASVIPGWVEALQLMNVGSKFELFIPADLAYGEGGAPPQIPPNSTLVFEIELLGIEKPRVPAFDEIPVQPSRPSSKGGANTRPPRGGDVQRTRFESGATSER